MGQGCNQWNWEAGTLDHCLLRGNCLCCLCSCYESGVVYELKASHNKVDGVRVCERERKNVNFPFDKEASLEAYNFIAFVVHLWNIFFFTFYLFIMFFYFYFESSFEQQQYI